MSEKYSSERTVGTHIETGSCSIASSAVSGRYIWEDGKDSDDDDAT